MVNPAEADPSTLLDSLATGLPDSIVEVERQRGMSDRLAGRPGRVVSLRVNGTDQTLSITTNAGGRLEAVIARVVRNVVISRETVTVARWLDALGELLRTATVTSAADSAATARLLATLGVVEAGADVAVDPRDVEGGLAALPARLAGRVPDDVVASVQRLCDLLVEIVPRVTGSPEQVHTVERTATDYLPTTLRRYLALPPDWANTHLDRDGHTPLDELRAQLVVLETAIVSMREAALSADAAALAANGLFLAERFHRSDLD